MTPRRARLVLVLVVLGVVGLGVFAWDPVYWWVMTERIHVETTLGSFGHGDGGLVRGWYSPPRGTDNGWAVLGRPGRLWYVETGYKAMVQSRQGVTYWNPDGTVKCQLKAPIDGLSNDSPPWLWGVTDQTAPSMPAWMKDDEQWQAAIDSQD